jgi:hypothetical protein
MSIGESAFIGTYVYPAFTGENLDSITIGADVSIVRDVFGTARNTFEETYVASDKAAGTYIFADGGWSKTE